LLAVPPHNTCVFQCFFVFALFDRTHSLRIRSYAFGRCVFAESECDSKCQLHVFIDFYNTFSTSQDAYDSWVPLGPLRGPSRTYQKPCVFDHFRPVPPKTLESECDPRLDSLNLARTSFWTLQKCCVYHAFLLSARYLSKSTAYTMFFLLFAAKTYQKPMVFNHF